MTSLFKLTSVLCFEGCGGGGAHRRGQGDLHRQRRGEHGDAGAGLEPGRQLHLAVAVPLDRRGRVVGDAEDRLVARPNFPWS